MEHRTLNCNQKKTATSSEASLKESDIQISNEVKNEVGNEYIKNAKIQISVNVLDFSFNANSQLNIACPISLVKVSFRVRSNDAQYEEINGSALKIQDDYMRLQKKLS